MRLSRFRRVFALLVVAAVFAAACGGDDDGDTNAAGDTTTEATEPTEDDTTTSAPPTSAEEADAAQIEVTAVDYAYEGLPESTSVGATLTLTNASDEELHELVAFRLPDDEDRPADELMKLPEEELGALFGGPPGMVLVAPPGGAPQIRAVGDGTLSEAGRYLVFCGIPTGADPQEYLEAAQASAGPPQVEGGPPHFVHGMYAEVTVE